jgi:CRISPR-associated endonuclease Csn1
MKHILGLDLGPNSIGWALIEWDSQTNNGKIIAANSRIIPMDQGMLGNFEKGNSISQTAERTQYRGTRRLRERELLRRERLHRVLHILGFLPEHYDDQIDFEWRLGQFKNHSEPKIAYRKENNKFVFLFQDSFNEMLRDFSLYKSELVSKDKKTPYDWTLYYLRKKALTQKITKEELAWIILNFNQKRGYYQLRGEEEESMPKDKLVELHSLKVIEIIDSGDRKGGQVWYNIVLENGWVYRRTSRVPLDLQGKTIDLIVTTDLDEEGNIKKDKQGNEKRSFRAPSPDDWTLIKKKTERNIEESHLTIGCYIYETLLKNPDQKIKGNLIRTIERNYYKKELRLILNKQKEFHSELKDQTLYSECINELYPFNENHKESIKNKDFTYLFLEDIIFYQRPLKSKKNTISICPLEQRAYKDKNGNVVIVPIRCIPKSHPLFQEFRLWQFLQNLKVYKREAEDVTKQLLPTEKDWQDLFDWLYEKKEIYQDALLKYPKFNLKKQIKDYRWNYVEDKTYPCNEVHALIASRIQKVGIPPLNKTDEYELWHILYSVDDKQELAKSLGSFATKKNFPGSFVEAFKKFPPLKKEYGSYSAQAIKKLLSLMRLGDYWSEKTINDKTKKRIDQIIDGEYDENIRNRTREKAIKLHSMNDFKGLPLWLASYIVYDRHSEISEKLEWRSPKDIEYYLHKFKQHSLKNPIVEQVVTETLRVVKDVWEYYGDSQPIFFDEIHIELGRDIKNTAEQRKRISEKNQSNENTNLRIRTLLNEFKEMGDIENIRPYSPNQQELFKIFEEDILSINTEIPDDIKKISKLAQPSKNEIVRYKLWLEQRYCSPYTGKIIPLNKLFTPAYEIEHIIPQSRYFDDSLSNKVICETAVNRDKGDKLAYEYIKSNEEKIIDLGFSQKVTTFSLKAYEDFIKNRYSSNKAKMKKLLLEDIPDTFVARQLNDSRYISKMVYNLLSALVRKLDEQEAISSNIISCNGTITSELKKQWGLNDVWNEIVYPRFERLNKLRNSNEFGRWMNKEGKKIFQIQVPLELCKGFNKKRIDHRHHALDAIVIACVTRDHINFLNNESAKSENKRHDLKNKLYEKGILKKPWITFTQDTKEVLLSSIVSFKQNLRIINRTVNLYKKWSKEEDGNYKKIFERQIKGDAWVIRKPMHKETIYGRVSLRYKKTVNLTIAIDHWQDIVDKELKSEIKSLIRQYGKFDKKTLLNYFKDRSSKLNNKDISKVEIYQYNNDCATSRERLDESFNSKKIENVSDIGIQMILKNHLALYDEVKEGKIIEHPELAFSPEGIDELNKNIIKLNNGSFHKPIYRVRTYEPLGNKFNVGSSGSKKNKFVEAAKGTNLFFAIYQNENNKRSYETIPLNIVIERQKQGLDSVPEKNEKGDSLLFSLSPNDLVYVPTEDEVESGVIDWSNKRKIAERVYKMVSSSGHQCFFIPNFVSNPIIQTVELGANNKAEKSWDNEMIKQFCIPLSINRLGIK